MNNVFVKKAPGSCQAKNIMPVLHNVHEAVVLANIKTGEDKLDGSCDKMDCAF